MAAKPTGPKPKPARAMAKAKPRKAMSAPKAKPMSKANPKSVQQGDENQREAYNMYRGQGLQKALSRQKYSAGKVSKSQVSKSKVNDVSVPGLLNTYKGLEKLRKSQRSGGKGK